MKSCQVCDYQVTDGAKFCPNCGANLGLSTSAVKATGIRTEQFRANGLELNKLYADFSVSFNNQGQVIVKIDGDEELKNAVEFEIVHGVVVMSGKLYGVDTDDDSMSISSYNGKYTVNGVTLDKTKKLKIEISLPWIASMEIAQYTLGSMIFTTDGGGLTLTNSGFLDIETMSFESLTAEIDGMGGLTVADVANDLKIDISGNGDFEAKQVSGKLGADVSGMGSVEIKNVNLTSAEIDLSGNGDVELKRGTIGRLTVDVSGMGSFEFGGSTEVGSFDVSGMGDIDVDSCSRITKQNVSGMGDITIG